MDTENLNQLSSIEYNEDIKQLITNINNLENENYLIIKNCPSKKAASNLISNLEKRNEICNKFPSIFAIRLYVNEVFEANDVKKPKNFENHEKILISFESTKGDQKEIY
ncbi:hypothetical protein PVAND_016624 [Polypedilum vanderplanki]|uniref:Uncharacterized protein n=1 Tax=Polypedilum vanderplanki TaxID=319348 RepID=A0A9J6BGH5_POLVA|nr:hypothetical protein PVAND_016624 [Polypedilum vanderplanki]